MELLITFILVRLTLCHGYDNLSSGHKTEQSSTHDWPGTNTDNPYLPNREVDREINTCMRTKMIQSGDIKVPTTVWWYVDLKDIMSVHSIRIQFRDYGKKYVRRQRGRMAGFSLYLSNTTRREDGFLCYKNSPNLPPLDHNASCVNYGRYVIYYNERLNGIEYPTGFQKQAYTELCEVIVSGCNMSGVYGYNCSQKCPENCQEHRCFITNGTCLGCTAGWIGEFCNQSCSFGLYGIECNHSCRGHCRDYTTCNHKTGKCDRGCADGWIGIYCNKECGYGMYGQNCSYLCSGNCLNSLTCDKSTGKCESCKAGYIGDLCNNTCSFGHFGRNCAETCSNHCRGKSCDHVDGVCEHGCDNGYKEPLCIENCDNGWYGWNCSQECSTNCIKMNCHHIDGTCLNGCNAGWIGPNCTKVCEKGTYGYNCNETCSEFCKRGNDCEHIDGNCTDGCQLGYTGRKCNKVCEKGLFGDNCSERCSDNCVNQTCNHVHGGCTFGCNPGWISPNCSKFCNIGFFGQNCSHTCLHCIHNECSPFDGNCSLGCEDGFTGHKCDQECKDGWFGRNCSKVCSENCINNSCDNINGQCTRGCESGWMGINDNATCNRLNGSCSNGCEESFTGEMCDESTGVMKFGIPNSDTNDSGVLGGLLSTCFVLIGIILLTAMFIIRRKRNLKEKNIAVRERIPNNSMSTFEEPIPIGEDVNSNDLNNHENITMDSVANPSLTAQSSATSDVVHPTNKTVIVKDLQMKINAMSMNGNAYFKEEYSEIRKGELHPCNEGKKTENVSKNRYTTTFPYDHSRVVLNTSNPKETDYINANFIEDVQGKRTYIATQGPKPKTIIDFWRMVWQEEVYIIVCLTNLKEGKKTKCAQYWPNVNDKMQYGDLFVRNQEEKIYANHTVRKLRIQNVSVKSERDVYMFHYTQWPDHGVPEPPNLVVFHRHVMRMSDKCKGKYTLVHCSAGIGRTGTYIALDALYRRAEKTGEIKVQKYLEVMRKDRMNMIQGEEQYKTVYLALLDSFRGKAKCIPTETFLQEFQEQNCYMNLGEVASKSPLYTEFLELIAMKKEYTDADIEFGQKNKGANLTPNVLPVDEYTCHIFNSNGERIYYNAVLIQSFTRTDSLISAQYPLPDFTEDFLRLMKGLYTPIIVSLCPLREFPSSTVWLPRTDENKTVGEFTTKFLECTNMRNFVKTDIVLHSKKGSDVRITILESTKWKGENDTSGRSVLIDLIKEAKMEENTHPDAKILVLSSL